MTADSLAVIKEQAERDLALYEQIGDGDWTPQDAAGVRNAKAVLVLVGGLEQAEARDRKFAAAIRQDGLSGGGILKLYVNESALREWLASIPKEET